MKTYAFLLVVLLTVIFTAGCGFIQGVKDGAAAEGGAFVAEVVTEAAVDRLPQSDDFREIKDLLKELPKHIPAPAPPSSDLPGYGLGAFLGAAAVSLLKGLGRKRGWFGKADDKKPDA